MTAEYQRNWRALNREKALGYERKWRATHADQKCASAKAAYRKTYDSPRRQAWYAANRERLREYHLRYQREWWRRKRFLQHPTYLAQKLRCSVRAALLKGFAGAAVWDLVGCPLKECREHLEAQFTEGMSWAAPKTFHIDHIKPCALFDLTDPDQLRACFHFSNLQPLTPSANLTKGKRWVDPLLEESRIPTTWTMAIEQGESAGAA